MLLLLALYERGLQLVDSTNCADIMILTRTIEEKLS